MPPVEELEVFARGAVAYGFAFALGAIFGSFGNVCIYRMPPTDEHPNGLSIAHPGSRCGACRAPIRWYDNLPIISYVLLRGRCRACHTGYSPRYMFVEIATGMLFVAVFHLAVVVAFEAEPLPLRLGRFAIYALFVFLLVVIALIDLDTKLILDRITYPAIPALYLASLALPERTWQDGLIGAAVGYGVVRLIADGYYLLTKREGMGYGDGKLLAMVGALLGWRGVLFALFGGSMVGSVIGVAALWLGRRRGATACDAGEAPDHAGDTTAHAGVADVPLRHVELPFGPFLVIGAITYLFVESWVTLPLGLLWGARGD